ncbi:MAG TPA: AsmA-like C-terminal domain-containing protein, partial [Desulfosarcina sp.]|nr:AsmA-like C-terminal domain-containing protein [Desulfosarcina sp.]
PLRQRHHVQALNLEARGNQVHIDPAAVIVVDGQTHRVAGAIAIEDDGYVLDLVHSATQMTLTLPEVPTDEQPPPEPATFSLWDLPLRGRILSRFDTLTLGNFQWSPFNAAVRLEAGSWHVRIEDAALCGIATPGSLHISPESMALSLTPEARDAAFDSTMACLLERPNLMDGQFDLSGRLESQGSPERLTRSVNGQMELNGRRGRIYRFNLLSKVLAVVNLTEIFRGKLPDLMKDGLAYESIVIQVDIRDSTCTIEEALIDGASANIAGQGTIDLVTGETEMIVLVAPFKTVDALVRYTPLVGDWLGGTLISIPVKVTGPFADPTVTPLAPSAVGSRLMKLMKKTIKLPVQIVAPLWDNGDDPDPAP